MTDLGEWLPLLILVAIPVADVVATIFFVWLYAHSKRSWLLLLMAVSNTIITGVFLFIGFLAFRRVLGYEPLSWGAEGTLIALMMLGLVPILKMAAFMRARRMRGAPPSFGTRD